MPEIPVRFISRSEKMTEIPKLTPRLRAAAELVESGSFVADVGTDHAYLPIALCLEGRIRGGVASDINQGPIDRARENIKKYGLEDRLYAVRTDGLDGIGSYEPDCVMILGMGGELIARILSDAPWTRKRGLRLCLQPMTHPEKLREFLASAGYSVTDEKIVIEENRIYQIILSEFTDTPQEYSEEQLLLGKINIERHTAELVRLAEHYVGVLEKRADGKRCAGADVAEEEALIRKIKEAAYDGKAAL